MLGVGSEAPDFVATDSTGGKLQLASLRGKSVVLYFFPKAFTGGCTTETRQFAQMTPVLAEKGVQVVGISTDSAETQRKFADHCDAAFPIVSDADGAIARAYGVLSFMRVAKRVTFFLDEKGIVRDVVATMLPGPHATRTRERYLGGAPAASTASEPSARTEGT